MKNYLLYITLFAFLFGWCQTMSGQQKIVNKKNREVQKEKKEIIKLSQTTETVMDSIVYFSYESENDSVRLLKQTYDTEDNGLFIIEDAAQALGSKFKGKSAGIQRSLPA